MQPNETVATYNAALQTISRATQEDLLFLNWLFGRHLIPLAIVTSGNVNVDGGGAVKHGFWCKCRASCSGSKEG
jgi:hypothetical protein